MGKRYAIVIGVAAAGVMALGAQTATSSTGDPVDSIPPDLQLSGDKVQNPTIRPGTCPITEIPSDGLSCRTCVQYHYRCTVLLRASCVDEACAVRAEGKLTKVKNDKLKPISKPLRPGDTKPLMLWVPLGARIQAGKALAEGKKVEAKVTVRATDAAGNVTTAKRTIRFVKGGKSWSESQ